MEAGSHLKAGCFELLFSWMNSRTLKIFYLISRKNGLLKSRYMNTDKLVCNCFIFMGLDIIVEFIIYAF